MNGFQKIITFPFSMITFLKGHQLFIKRRYAQAIFKFEKCLANPKFQNDLLFSFHGQALADEGRLQEAHPFLVKACESYEKDNWVFEDEFTTENAKKCIEALKHTCKHLSSVEGSQYFDKKPKMK